MQMSSFGGSQPAAPFVLRGRFGAMAAPSVQLPPGSLPVRAVFDPQSVRAGERIEVYSHFYSMAPIVASGAEFTLDAIGAPVAGYDSVVATVVSDVQSGGRMVTVSALIDLSSGAPSFPPPPGLYTGRFTLATSDGEVHLSMGLVELVPVDVLL